MRELDASGVDRILARAFPGDDGLALAMQDRLRRAGAGVRPRALGSDPGVRPEKD
jgi:hypothetical protein